jgi:leucyl aminopeptidase (aminopeptidase T)
MKDILLAKGAAKLVDECLSIKAGERAVIVTDLNKVNIAHVLAFVLQERGNEVSIHIMKARTRHGEEPPDSIAAAMLNADVILMPTTYSLTHTKARQEANKKGARILSLPGYTEETLMGGGIEADFKAIRTEVVKAANLLDKGETARITSSLGSDFTASIKGKKSVIATGVADSPGTWGAPPAVEAAIAPEEGTASGILHVDGVLIPGGLVKDDVVVEFEKGKIVKISGGKQAHDFEQALQGYKDPNVFCAVELGIGFNPKAELGRNYLEDETTYGTLHLGLGEGRTFGSTISACAHLDLVFDRATLSIDGKEVVKNRVITL